MPMDRRVFLVSTVLAALCACSVRQDGPAPETGADLEFSVAEGQSDNYFIRHRGISGHLNLRTRPTPRLVVAFPAGNSGAALVFDKTTDDEVWGSVDNLRIIEHTDTAGRRLRGLQADITVRSGSLSLAEADVGSLRFLRKAVDYSKLPTRPPPDLRVDDGTLRLSRERPDGESAYELQIEVLAGALRTGQGLGFDADAEGSLRLRVAATSGDPLETPVSAGRLLTDRAADRQALREALAFLTYESKMLAGSWRFLTYFGRDTLLSIRLLMPVLTAKAAEIGLASVLERINKHGEVAHEEEIGELAVYRNLANNNEVTARPIYDYDMVDDNLLLAPVLSSYIETFGLERANGFLSGRATDTEPLRARLASNLALVVEQANAFAVEPDAANLVSIKAGLNDGNWRDSEEGLVGGRYPYDVNAVLMPAALHAAAAIVGSGVLENWQGRLPDEETLRGMAAVWEEQAAGYFRVSITARELSERVAAYARDNGFPLPDVADAGVSFHAVALNADLEPIPVMHSDIATDLLFLRRPENRLAEIVENLSRVFPAGLSTPIGILAANPAYAGAEQQALVTRNHYHGTVIWSWQQAMIIAGLDAQLGREDLSAELRDALWEARRRTWRAMEAAEETISTELWSFAVLDNEFTIAPFGESEGHLTESNAVQLWSTVFLALQEQAMPPER